ncbi:MAG: phosphoribosylanthranilate isomerase [Leptospiraceae bacterium]|nr:phosphoribosylanthranilate isomerase [Leptospiraceae bacterium]MDW7975089.1 phosphoribosylanthranilate isomerase [Leptospiraceae bacterium]
MIYLEKFSILRNKIHLNIPLVKICGNKYLDEAYKVAKFHPDFMGWIFAKQSPRKVNTDEAKSIIKQIKRDFPEIFHVAVFADNSLFEIITITKEINQNEDLIDFLQVVEGADFIDELSKQLIEKQLMIPIIPVIRPTSVLTDQSFFSSPMTFLWIVDRYDPKLKGGTGKVIPKELFSEQVSKPFLIAGGIQHTNAKEMLKVSGAKGIDVSSGIEDAPGVKNEKKLELLFQEIKNL